MLNVGVGKENSQETEKSRGTCDAVERLGSVERPIQEEEDIEEDDDDDIGDGIPPNKEQCAANVRQWVTLCQ